MLDQIDQLMADIRRQEETTRQYQLQALSSQINPHFLYNTLDTIIWMAEFQDSQRVVQVTKSLATYFRLALNQGKDLICLSEKLIMSASIYLSRNNAMAISWNTKLMKILPLII